VIPKAESKSRRHHERKPVSLLLLEDDPRFAELLGARLRKMRLAELRLEVAGSLAAALGRLAAEPFDLVLSDLNLPDSSGLATLEALSRAGEQLIIVLTGDPNPALRASAMEAGAYDFVSKDDLGPATLERLVRLATIQANTYRTLRESEARFRGLTALSSDWYWEQDAELRFVATEGSSDARGGITPAAHIGKRHWELPATEIVKQTWDEHKAVLKARRPFRDLLLRRIGEGEARFVSVSGEPIFDLRGTFRGYRGVATDVTDRVLAEQELRESEGRFRRLTQLIADVYWEQDEQFRFTSFTDSSPRGPEGLGTRALIGKRRWELGYVNMTPADWARHIAILEAHQPFQNLELCRLAEGRKLWINTSAEPVFDAAGAFKGYRGVGQDITERKREEELLRLEHAVTRSLAQADTAASGVEAVIRAICETQSWECGRYFFVDEKADVLRFGEAWGVPGPAVERFLAKSRTLTYRRGEGLSGCVWQASEPLWVSDVSRDPRASGSSPAAMAGGSLQGGSFVFPVMSEGRTIGVLSFSSGDVCGPDQRLLQAVGVIGSQVGQFLQRKGSEEELRRFRLAMDNSADMIVLIERATMRFVDVNETMCKLLGYSRAEMLAMGPHEVLPVSREELEKAYDALIADPSQHSGMNSHYRRKDGSLLPFESKRRVLRSGASWFIAAISRDLTESLRAEARQVAHLHYQEKIARLGQSALGKREPADLIEEAVQSVLEGLKADAVAYVEPGPAERQVVVRALLGIAGSPSLQAEASFAPHSPLAQVLERGEPVLLEAATEPPLPFSWARELRSALLVPVRGDSGSRGALCALAKGSRTFGPEETRFLDAAASVLSAGLQRIDSETRLAYLAQFDALTGLPNRALLSDRFSQMIVQALRHAKSLGVLFIDLDDFKLVNDSLGHAGGDALLKEAAQRLQASVRGGDTVARISGDEFAVILADLARPEDAAIVAQKIIDRLAPAMEVRGQEVFVTASLGIAAFPADGNDVETLLGAADAAMYRAKQAGRNQYQFFTADMNQRTRARAQLGSELRRALEREEFVLHYQPKFELQTATVCGAEALLRWRHPERGVVLPAEFIPVLEETGLIVPVGEWVVRRACEDLKSWIGAGLPALPIAVNLSARQFRQPDLDMRIRALVTAAGIDPGLIELEITESQLMHDPDQAIRMLRALREAGIRIAIDDFGTGYSSLAYLTRFPLAALKIDRSFVADVLSDPADATIVRTIVDMAQTLGFTVVAEGVETEAQAGFLRGLGCEQAQGYFFAKPMPAGALRDLLAATRGLITGLPSGP